MVLISLNNKEHRGNKRRTNFADFYYQHKHCPKKDFYTDTTPGGRNEM